MDERIRFVFDGKQYFVSRKVYDNNLKVLLPNGKLIKVLNWNETHPPQVQDWKEERHIYKNVLVSKDMAISLGAELAQFGFKLKVVAGSPSKIPLWTEKAMGLIFTPIRERNDGSGFDAWLDGIGLPSTETFFDIREIEIVND